MIAAALFLAAAVAEIVGCYAVWLWVRGGSPWLLVGAALCLAAFAWFLAQVETAAAGRSFAAYGGLYIVAALIWMRVVEGVRLTLADGIGAALCLAGAAVILLGRHASD